MLASQNSVVQIARFSAATFVVAHRLKSASSHPALRDGVNDFLGRDVSNHLILGERTAAEATERGIETAAAGIEGRQDLRLAPAGCCAGGLRLRSLFAVITAVTTLRINSGSATPTVSAREIEPIPALRSLAPPRPRLTPRIAIWISECHRNVDDHLQVRFTSALCRFVVNVA